MRNLDECQAEVFRRSEKRIKERKRRRNHMLMTCIPLVLCIAFLLPVFLKDEKKAAPNAMGSPESVMDNASLVVDESLSEVAASVTVLGEEFSNALVDDTVVRRIYAYLSSFGTRGTESNGATDNKVAVEDAESAEDGFQNTAGAPNRGYMIKVVILGDETVYYLDGNTLENQTTNQTYSLSEKQVTELQGLLGIPRP